MTLTIPQAILLACLLWLTARAVARATTSEVTP